MRRNASLEQGVCAMLMMAMQDGGAPVQSSVMAQTLGISDSYLKKTLRKLVAAGMVESSAKPGGGHTLAREPRSITLADAHRALCGEITPALSDLPERIFPDKRHTAQTMAMLAETVAKAEEAYLAQLAALTLADLYDSEAAAKMRIDWAARLGERS